MTGRLTDRQRLDWLRLIRTETVGPRTFRALINRFGSAEAAIDGLPGLLRARGLHAVRVTGSDEAEREHVALTRRGGRFIALGEPDYPAPLAAIDAPPPLIAVRGDVAALATPCAAIVGARNASALGLKFAGQIARALAEAGITVVSGLARGVDAAAHQSSLPDPTIGVSAAGLARLYPAEHEPLVERMIERGAVISEMPLEWVAVGRDFPRRNRLISGLSLAVVVVEAAMRSGSLITARFAGEQGREVFAVPGSPLDPRAEGTNTLISDGATLLMRPQQVVDAVLAIAEGGKLRSRSGAFENGWPSAALWDENPVLAGPDHADFGDDDDPEAAGIEATDRVLAALGAAPAHADDVIFACGLPARVVQNALVELEIGRKARREGAGWVRT